MFRCYVAGRCLSVVWRLGLVLLLMQARGSWICCLVWFVGWYCDWLLVVTGLFSLISGC